LLRTLDISGFAHLSRESVAAIAQGHPRLRRLIMRDCSPARTTDHHQGDGDDVSGPAVAKGADDAAAVRERASRRKAKAELTEALVGTLGASCRLLEELEFGWRRDSDSDHDDDYVAAQTEKQQQPQQPQHTPAATSVQRTAAPAKNWMTSTVTIDINATGDGDECSGSFTTMTTVMDRLVDANPQLRRLVLDGVSSAGGATATTTMMDDDTLELMGRRLTRLDCVEFHRSADVTACGLRRLLQSARRLRRLVVRDCPRVGVTASAAAAAAATTTGSNDAVLNAVACFGCHSLEVVDLRGSGVCHGEPAVAAVAAKCYVLRELAVDVGCHVLPPHQHGSARRQTAPPVSACLSPAAASGGRRFPVAAPLQPPPQQPPRVVESLIALSPSLTRLDLVVVAAVASGQPAATAPTPPRKYAPVF
jgi:hypothetical protein